MKRVFILSSHPLLGRGIETLLCQETGLQIVGHEKDLDRAIEQIKTLQPDVVIVDSNDSEDNRALVLMRVLKEGLRPCVVGLNLRDNTVSIYQGEQRVIEELRDFVEAIKSEVRQPVSTQGQGRQAARDARDTTTIDRFGRTLNYLRVSVTDRCNLRCVYCMPPEGVRPKPREAILHSEEIARMVEAAAGIGFRTIRLTGGEPLVRRGVVGLVKRLAAIPGVDEVALTTNAILLSSYARDLATAGLKRVNISLDSLRPERFRRITRLGDLKSVWQGIEAAEAAGLVPLKINVVVIRGFNDDEVADFARLTFDHAWHIRFIEVMPLAGVSEWGSDVPPAGERLVTAGEVRHRLEELGPLEPTSGLCGHGPARYYRLPGAQGTVGFISPMSEHFCASCNRLRLTADGWLRACLFADEGVHIKPALDAGADLTTLRALIRQVVGSKPEHRPFSGDVGVTGKAMSMIGG